MSDSEVSSTPAYQRSDLVKAIAGYSLLRFGLFAVLTGIFMIFLPLVIAMAFAVVGQLPLSMLLFSAQKQKVLALMARGPGAERAKLRASLRGE